MKRKMMSGEVIRNTAASFALLATSAGGTTDKIAALGGALASIPGPIGMMSAAVAAGATVWGIFGKKAKEASDEVESLGKKLVDLGKARVAGLDALADRISGAAAKVGMDLRANFAAGGGGKGVGQSLYPGDANSPIKLAGALSSSGLNEQGKQDVLSSLSGARSIGKPLTDSLRDSIINEVQYRQEAFAPVSEDVIMAAAKARDEAAARGGGIFGTSTPFRGVTGSEGDVGARGILREITPSDQQEALTKAFANMSSEPGQNFLRSINRSESPAVAESSRTITDATSSGAIAAQALKAATDRNATSTIQLTTAIIELDATIKATKGKQEEARKQAYSGWRSFFNGSEPATSP
jgi:hypothetical protein